MSECYVEDQWMRLTTTQKKEEEEEVQSCDIHSLLFFSRLILYVCHKKYSFTAEDYSFSKSCKNFQVPKPIYMNNIQVRKAL